MNVIEKDILTVDKGIIFHQVNCKGVMGSGVALALKNKWPVVFEAYQAHCKAAGADWHLLGDAQIVPVAENLYVCNVFSQYDYGYGQKHTEYSAIDHALQYSNLPSEYLDSDLPCYFPYKFGSDRGGGDWNVVKAIIEFRIRDVIFCKLPENKQ